jgi:hypothetical protein
VGLLFWQAAPVMMMPGLNGLDLGAALARESPDLKILYISGFVGSVAGYELSADFLARPLVEAFRRGDAAQPSKSNARLADHGT